MTSIASPVLPASDTARRSARAGVMYGASAYLWWGFITLYFKLVDHVPALSVLAHRVVWSVLFLVFLIVATRQTPAMRAALTSRRTLGLLSIGSLLIAVNWYVFIYAVETDRVLHASLGYYINPLVNVLLAMVVLRERLRLGQWIGVALAATGVIILASLADTLPWISLTLALSFSLYGLVRKLVPIGPIVGLLIETTALLPVGFAILAWAPAGETPITRGTYGLLMLAGVITALPLLWFAAAAQRLRLTTLGFLQYLAPTCQFLLAVIVLGEPFSSAQLVAFAFIWTALAVYTVDSVRAHRAAIPVVEMAE